MIVASEQMDEDLGGAGFRVGEMVHFGPDLDVASRIVLDEPPAQPLRIEQLKPQIAASQRTVRDLQAAA